MRFERIARQTQFLDPRRNYALTQIESEIRLDPLTGFSGRIAHFAQGDRPSIDLNALNQASLTHGCPFCPAVIMEVTPKFPEEICGVGRFRQGEAVVFPNLSPYDAHSAVAVITQAHLMRTQDFSDSQWVDALTASVDYFAAVNRAEHHIGYGLIAANYMPMAGASLLHPHMQIYATDRPGNWLGAQISAAQRYYDASGHNFWEDLLAEEQTQGVRYLGSTGRVQWLVPFVPLGFIGDVEAVFPDRFTILDLTEQDLQDFSQGLIRVLDYMNDTNLYAFNLAFYPGQAPTDHTWVHARISFRGMINPALNSPDVSAIRHLYDEPFTTVYPEELASTLRGYFSES